MSKTGGFRWIGAICLAGLTGLFPLDRSLAESVPAPSAAAAFQAHDFVVRFDGLTMTTDWSRTARGLLAAGLIGTRTVPARGRTYCAIYRDEFGLPGCSSAIEALAVQLNRVQPERLPADALVTVPALTSHGGTYDRRFATDSAQGRQGLAAFEERFSPYVLGRGSESWRDDGVILLLRRVTTRFRVVGPDAYAKAMAVLSRLAPTDGKVEVTSEALPSPAPKPVRPALAVAVLGEIEKTDEAGDYPGVGTADADRAETKPIAAQAPSQPAAGADTAPAEAGVDIIDKPGALIVLPTSATPVLLGLATAATSPRTLAVLPSLLPLPFVWFLLNPATAAHLGTISTILVILALAGCAVLAVLTLRWSLRHGRLLLARWLAPELAKALAQTQAAPRPEDEPVRTDARASAQDEADLTRLLAQIRGRRRAMGAAPCEPAGAMPAAAAWLPASQPLIVAPDAIDPTLDRLFGQTGHRDSVADRRVSRSRRGLESLVNLPSDRK